VSELEKLRISAFYHSFVTGEVDKEIEALSTYKATYPRDARAPNNLSDAYFRTGNSRKRRLKLAKACVSTLIPSWGI